MPETLTLAKKMERALRNGTGFKVADDELPILMRLGVFDTVGAEKIKEL